MEPPAQQVGAALSDDAPSLQAFFGPSHTRDGAPERSGRSRGQRRPERARRRGRDPAHPNASPDVRSAPHSNRKGQNTLVKAVQAMAVTYRWRP